MEYWKSNPSHTASMPLVPHEPKEAGKHHAKHPLAPGQIMLSWQWQQPAASINYVYSQVGLMPTFMGQGYVSQPPNHRILYLTPHWQLHKLRQWVHHVGAWLTNREKEGGSCQRGPASPVDLSHHKVAYWLPPKGTLTQICQRSNIQPISSVAAMWSCPRCFNIEWSMFTTPQPHGRSLSCTWVSSQPEGMITHRQP